VLLDKSVETTGLYAAISVTGNY